MQIVIHGIRLSLRHREKDVISAAQEIVRQHNIKAKDFRIHKQSIDARRGKITYVYSVAAEAEETARPDGKAICALARTEMPEIPKRKLPKRPVVVGMGPCGLFAAYILAKSGNPPLLTERGEPVEERIKSVKRFWETGALNPDSNIQFGEGGAGTFSDGKLTTRIGDGRQRLVLETLAAFGAPPEILYQAKPHVGTDKLQTVIQNLRKELLRLGVEIRFETALTGIRSHGGKLTEIELNHSEAVPCEKLILAIGHSSRDTYEMLMKQGVLLEPKAFAAGVRVEHLQSVIDLRQYGEIAGELPPADYRLVYNGKDRSCYSFCMCPGGQVVNASSEPERLVVNGMSNHARDGKNANSALVVSVKPEDFETAAPLGGMAFQRKYEALAYRLCGGKAPIQRTADFMQDRPSDTLRSVTPSVASGWAFAELRKCLPEFITDTLRKGLEDFEHKIPGFAFGDGVMTGVEMRTSAPVRILRTAAGESVSIRGLYPAGEGAGYAGGIVSAAVDGIRCALQCLGTDDTTKN